MLENMEKQVVLLIRIQPLFSEAIEQILKNISEIELILIDCAEASELAHHIQNLHPAMVLLAGEKTDDRATHLISALLDHFEDIPVVWAELEKTSLRLYTSHSLSATSSELINTIRKQGIKPIDALKKDTKSGTGI